MSSFAVPHDGGCWHCYLKDLNLQFSTEFDTYVHLHCIEKALKDDPADPEALIMKKELMPDECCNHC